MTFNFDVTIIRNILNNDLLYALQPTILGNPYTGDENDLILNPIGVLNHISNVIRLMKERCNHIDLFNTYNPSYEVRVRRIGSEDYFSPKNISTYICSRTGIVNHSISFEWDGYTCSIRIENGKLSFSYNRSFGAQCEFSDYPYDNVDWNHENLPLGLFDNVSEFIGDYRAHVNHEPSGESFQEKMMDTIWYLFYRIYRAGFVNAIKDFDEIPEDGLDIEEDESEQYFTEDEVDNEAEDEDEENDYTDNTFIAG